MWMCAQCVDVSMCVYIDDVGVVMSAMCMIVHGHDSTLQRDCTALHLASERGHASCVELLLSHGANVHAVDEVNDDCMS